MNNNTPYFNEKIFNDYTENYKISILTSLLESDIDKIKNAGFIFDFTNNSFISNICIINKIYNLKIYYYDSNYRLYVKIDKESAFTDKSLSFPAKKTTSSINSNHVIYNIDLMFIKFEQWIKNIEFATIKTIMFSKIPDGKSFETSYKTDKWEVIKVSKTYIYVKLFDDTTKTLDINMNNFTKDDILMLDKAIENTLKEIEDNKNRTFKDFIIKEKNTIVE